MVLNILSATKVQLFYEVLKSYIILLLISKKIVPLHRQIRFSSFLKHKLTMKKTILLALMALIGLHLEAQNVSISKALFKQGDDMNWAKPDVDDSSWSEIDITMPWDKQGFPQNTKAYGWYRIHVNIPKSVFQGADQQNALVFNQRLGQADGVHHDFSRAGRAGAEE